MKKGGAGSCPLRFLIIYQSFLMNTATPRKLFEAFAPDVLIIIERHFAYLPVMVGEGKMLWLSHYHKWYRHEGGKWEFKGNSKPSMPWETY